ncbi:hypothetical protein FACS1894199_12430 [Bacteroidia bacterium]|nr:hypothetical protein FACS1894199_12430 [Bacteroidia bacterium]
MHYSYWKERFKKVFRFWNKRGFGVHSPVLFNLITQAISDRKHRYTYHIAAEQAKGITRKERKLYRMLFRLTNYLEVKNILCLTEKMENLSLYLSALPKDVVISDERPEKLDGLDFIYVAEESIGKIEKVDWQQIGCENTKIGIVLEGIYSQKNAFDLWKELQNKARVSIDAMWYGILFFDAKLQKGRYKI